MTDPTDPGGRHRKVSDVAVSLIRTWVPIGAGFVLAYAAARWHVVLSAHASAAAGAGAAAVCAAGYYAAARFLERRRGGDWRAKTARLVGRWMLAGVIHQPVYAPGGDAARLDPPA